MMKDNKDFLFTSVRCDARTRMLHMRNMSLSSLRDMIVRDVKRDSLEKFRKGNAFFESLGAHIEFYTQRITVPASFRREGTKGWRFNRYNGLVLLSVGRLTGLDEADTVKRLARMHPSTFAAVTGSSGKSVKIMVRVCPSNGTLPQTEDEAKDFHCRAYNAVLCSYEGMVGFPITRVEPTLEQNFVRTYDPSPYFNPAAVPMRIDADIDLTLEPTDDNTLRNRPLERMEPGQESYAELERRFVALTTRVLIRTGLSKRVQQEPRIFLSLLARECCLTGFPLEEAITHALVHLDKNVGEEDMRCIFESAYQMAADKFDTKNAYNKTQRNMLMLRDYMRQHYVLRHNVIQNLDEYRLNTTWDTHFHLLDDRTLAHMVEEARMRDIDIWDKDVLRNIRSAAVQYNPVESFLNSVRGTWDGTDRIGLLADTVATRNPKWREWFHRWFLSMTAQWLGIMGQYGNSVAPLLIGRQGWRKSTFCRNLLPDELQFGYTDQLNLSSRQEVDRTICQYLLVNLDEFDQLTRRSQDGYLKNLLQRADIRARRPYKSQVSQMRRYASFIGTSNQRELLTDPTGGRRYLCIELSGPIDVSSRPDYRQLYAQAVELVERGERYWFDDNDVEEIMENNRSYMNLGAAELLFHDIYSLATPEEKDAQWLSAGAMLEELRSHAGSRLTLSPVSFGRYVSNLPHVVSKRTNQGTKYCVKRTF